MDSTREMLLATMATVLFYSFYGRGRKQAKGDTVISRKEAEESAVQSYTNDQKSIMKKAPININNQNLKILPTTRLCFSCCKKGKEHPIEHFLRYPCCGHFICRHCMGSNGNSQFCGECKTSIPFDNVIAYFWLQQEQLRLHNDSERKLHLLGRIRVFGEQLFVDELLYRPEYRYKKLEPPCKRLAVMCPTNVELGVKYLDWSIVGYNNISAMLDLADIYCTNFFNDAFQQDKKKAEEWYVKALGNEDCLFPLAFTHYGDFLLWERRFKEARDMYEIAAKHGHCQGQYEYAVCLLEGIGIGSTTENLKHEQETVSNDQREKAIELLCKVCEKGFYAPAYTYLVKALIKIAEEAYGTVLSIGNSPIPRILQILKLGQDCPYGNSNHCEEETLHLIEYYKKRKDKCSNCGEAGSETYPLRSCETCDSVAYCSKMCQKRDYRDGHKFDCCSRNDLFCFKHVRLTLPWVNKADCKRDGIQMPSLSAAGSHPQSLIQMVEDETEELYGEEDQDYDEYVLVNLMIRMRQNLETFLNRELPSHQPHTSPPPNLHDQIESFAKKIHEYPGCNDFIDAMNKVRKLGNDAAHDSKQECINLYKIRCEDAVREFRLQKEKYLRYKERNESLRDVNTPPMISKDDDDVDNTKTPEKEIQVKVKHKDKKKAKDEVAPQPVNSSLTKEQIASPDPMALKEATDRLTQCIHNKDLEGILEFESEFKGVTGFAKLRKRAKKEVKKLSKDSADHLS